MTVARPGTLAEGVRQVHREAAGMLGIHVVQQVDVPRLLLDALAGNETAMMLLSQVNDCTHRIQAAPAERQAQCGCCGRDLQGSKYAVVIATPEAPEPSTGLAMAVCTRCGTTRGAIRAAAIRALRLLWPDTRPVSIHDKAGHA